MKRFHINLSVNDLSKSILFYSSLFGVQPGVKKNDYAKWMLDDPHINFSISTHGTQSGIDHIGIQAEDENEFNEIRKRLNSVETQVLEQPDVTCCYAQSSKSWVHDPDGIAWEAFLTLGETTTYNDMTTQASQRVVNGEQESSSCCTPSSTSCNPT